MKERKKERGRERGVLNRLRDFHDGEATNLLACFYAPNLQVEVKAITEPMTNSSKPIPELCGMLTATKKTAVGRASPCPPNPILVAHPKGGSDRFRHKIYCIHEGHLWGHTGNVEPFL